MSLRMLLWGTAVVAGFIVAMTAIPLYVLVSYAPERYEAVPEPVRFWSGLIVCYVGMCGLFYETNRDEP